MTTLNQTWDYTCALCDKVGLFQKNAKEISICETNGCKSPSCSRVDWF